MNLSKKYKQDGYVIIDLIDKDQCDVINQKIEKHINSGSYKENTKIYKYNEGSHRVVEAWKYIPEITKIAHSDNIKNILFDFYKKKPLPFSSINFTHGSNQPLHSDYVHFGSIPEGYLCGVWIALEDIHPGCGELQIGLETNNWPIFRFSEHGLTKPKSLKDLKANYNFYEDWVKKKIKQEKVKIKKCILKKGQAVIWDFNLLHGGSKILNPSLTRKSMVLHYHFDKTIAYNPNFSFFDNDIYQKRSFNVIGENNE